MGLGTAGYISSSQLLSTTTGIYTAIANNPGSVSGANLTSTVVGLGTAGYVSTLSNVSYISATQNIASSFSGNLADALTLVLFDL